MTEQREVSQEAIIWAALLDAHDSAATHLEAIRDRLLADFHGILSQQLDEVREALAEQAYQRKTLAAQYEAAGIIELAVMYERSANSIDAACRAALSTLDKEGEER